MADQTTTPTPSTDFQTPPPATVTVAQQFANEFLGDFRELIKKLPKFESPHPIAAKQIKGHRNVPQGFAKTAVDSVENAPELQAIPVLDPAGVNSDIQQIEAFTPMLDEVQAWVDAGRFSIAVKQARANIAGQRILNMAKVLASDPNFAHLGSRVEAMVQSKKKKRPATPQPEEPPNGGPLTPLTPH